MAAAWTYIAPVLLLVVSNVFMTFAWYGQLKVEHRAMWLLILISGGSPSSNIASPCPPTAWAGRSMIRPS